MSTLTGGALAAGEGVAPSAVGNTPASGDGVWVWVWVWAWALFLALTLDLAWRLGDDDDDDDDDDAAANVDADADTDLVFDRIGLGQPDVGGEQAPSKPHRSPSGIGTDRRLRM